MVDLVVPEWVFCRVCADEERTRKAGPGGDGTTPPGWHLTLIRRPDGAEPDPEEVADDYGR